MLTTSSYTLSPGLRFSLLGCPVSDSERTPHRWVRTRSPGRVPAQDRAVGLDRCEPRDVGCVRFR